MYFFILGHNPDLSIAEIVSVLRALAYNFRVVVHSAEVLIIETERKIKGQQLQQELGGTIKIGEIILGETKLDKNFPLAAVLNQIKGQLPKNQKVYFGFSIYNLPNEIDLGKLTPQIKKLAMGIKKSLKSQGITSRWVISKERFLSSVIVHKNKLLEQGAEFCFLVDREKIYLGRTISCQEFKDYELYDFGRPVRPIKEGMLPPKLAKIMINLAQITKDGTILDPFCGSGTILQEAAQLGYQKIYGADLSNEAVNYAKQNLSWLKTKLNIEDQDIKIFQSDVRQISQKIPNNIIDAVITEPDLGPIKLKQEEILKTTERLGNLYLSAFQEFRKILKPNGRVVMIWPVFQFNSQRYFLPILDDVIKQGWQVMRPIPDNIGEKNIIKLTERQSIIYSRPNQKVLREIFIFQPEAD